MATRQERIKAVLDRYDIPWNKETVWAVQGTPVILHKVLEEISAKAGIVWTAPTIVRATDREAVIMCHGVLGEKMEWSIGEARIIHMISSGRTNQWGKPEMIADPEMADPWGNYSVSGKQSAYPWAMAEKRAKDRVILKLVELSGVAYSETEADEFSGKRDSELDDTKQEQQPDPLAEAEAKVRAAIDRADQPKQLAEYLEKPGVQQLMSDLPGNRGIDLRQYGLTKLHAMGGGGSVAEEKRPEAVVSKDPYHLSNLATLPNRVSTAIKDARNATEIEEGIEKVLVEGRLDWNMIPTDIQKAIDKAAQLRAEAAKK